MKRSRPPELFEKTNHELGKDCMMIVDGIDAGMTVDIHISRRVRSLLMEVAARLHPEWPGETVENTYGKDREGKADE